MEENKLVVLVGIPGVGKSTLLAKVVEILRGRQIKASVNSFGTMMLETARENGIQDRDEMRKLAVSKQQNLQKTAAKKISQLDDDVVIVDTHAFISSPEGYYPGLPEHVLEIIKPTNFISVSAKPEEIYSRRINDTSRNRDLITLPDIKAELDVQAGMISACAVITGSPVKFVQNDEGKVDEAASIIIKALGL
ncbi:MAG: adenylate kinase [Thaumarchaeota archaeon]|nr:adenylate kinase [Nitrososphaerota archaeon]